MCLAKSLAYFHEGFATTPVLPDGGLQAYREAAIARQKELSCNLLVASVLEAVEKACGEEIDYGQVKKVLGSLFYPYFRPHLADLDSAILFEVRGSPPGSPGESQWDTATSEIERSQPLDTRCAPCSPGPGATALAPDETSPVEPMRRLNIAGDVSPTRSERSS